jgi:hypothetical protein
MHFFYSKADRDASESDILDEFDFINDFGFEEYKIFGRNPWACILTRVLKFVMLPKVDTSGLWAKKVTCFFPEMDLLHVRGKNTVVRVK